MIKLNINSNKVKNILKALGYLFTVGIAGVATILLLNN